MEVLKPKKTMRDTFLAEVLAQMDRGENVFFLSADFGAPTLDVIRERHPGRFINVGIAEQNLINVSTGLSLEGITVYAYAIAPFITMRCCEQIRVNLAILSQVRPLNVNLIGVGAGFSYDVSGPTHHCLEDISIMRTFPNLEVISPADWGTVAALPQYCLDNRRPKYLRFDSKPTTLIHSDVSTADLHRGYIEMSKGADVCMVSTGFLTHKTQEVVEKLKAQGQSVGHIDLFNLKLFDEIALCRTLAKYKKIVTLEEGFVGKGGLDALVGELVLRHQLRPVVKAMGLKDNYIFHIGSREQLHEQNSLGSSSIYREAQAV